MNAATYEKQLTKTAQFLKKPRTAAEVAEKFGISRFAAYERLAALRNRGAVVITGSIAGAEGKTGPKARTWVGI